MSNAKSPRRGSGIGCIGFTVVGLIVLFFIVLSFSSDPAPPGGGSGPCEWERVKTSKSSITHVSLTITGTLPQGTKPKPGGGTVKAPLAPAPRPNVEPKPSKPKSIPAMPKGPAGSGYIWKLDCD